MMSHDCMPNMVRFIGILAIISAAVAAESTRLRILTQNVQLTPVVGGTVEQQVQRAGKLVEAIKLAHPPYDVIGLEEVFMEDPMQVLINGLETQYPYILTAIPGGNKLFGSGLFFASRFPIKRSIFHQFTKASGFDAIEPKGVLVADLNVTANEASGNLVIALTHQQSDGSSEIMTSQLKEGGETLATFLRYADRSMQDQTTVLYMGDMNIDEGSQPDLYTQMQSSLGQETTDLFRKLHSNDSGLTWPLTPFPYQRLDYIFGIQRSFQNTCQFGSAASFLNATVDTFVLNGTLSDHFGVNVWFDMKLKSNEEISAPIFCAPDAIQIASNATSNFSWLISLAIFLVSLIGAI